MKYILNRKQKFFSDCLQRNNLEFIKFLNDYIDNLINISTSEETPLFLSTFHRNTFTSSLILELEQLFVISKISAKSSHNKFFTDSINVFNILNERKYNVIYTGRPRTKFFQRFRFVLFHLIQKILTKTFIKNSTSAGEKGDVIFEVFENFKDNAPIGSHYYPQLLNSKFKATKIKFLVSLLDFNATTKLFTLRKKIEDSKIPIIITDFKYSFNSVWDFWGVINEYIRNMHKAPKFCGFETKILLKNKLKLEKFSRSSFNAFLRFNHIKKSNEYDNSALVVWNENHSLDKAACLGNSLRKNKIKIVGYQGFSPSVEKNYEHPTRTDLEKNIAPYEVYKIFFSDKSQIQIEKKGPAFRFEKLFKKKNYQKPRKTICIAFPLVTNNKIIDDLLVLNDFLSKQGYKVFSKIHPLENEINSDRIKQRTNAIGNIIDFYKLISSSTLFISSGLTNMYFESFCLGRYSINYREGTAINKHFLNESNFYKETYSFTEIKKIADAKITVPKDMIQEYLGLFIEPNSDNINKFLSDIAKND